MGRLLRVIAQRIWTRLKEGSAKNRSIETIITALVFWLYNSFLTDTPLNGIDPKEIAAYILAFVTAWMIPRVEDKKGKVE